MKIIECKKCWAWKKNKEKVWTEEFMSAMKNEYYQIPSETNIVCNLLNGGCVRKGH